MNAHRNRHAVAGILIAALLTSPVADAQLGDQEGEQGCAQG